VEKLGLYFKAYAHYKHRRRLRRGDCPHSKIRWGTRSTDCPHIYGKKWT